MVTVSLLDVSIIIVGPSPQMLAQNACSRSKIIYRFRSGDNSTLVACVFFRPTLQLNPGCEDKKAFSHLLVFFFLIRQRPLWPLWKMFWLPPLNVWAMVEVSSSQVVEWSRRTMSQKIWRLTGLEAQCNLMLSALNGTSKDYHGCSGREVSATQCRLLSKPL